MTVHIAQRLTRKTQLGERQQGGGEIVLSVVEEARSSIRYDDAGTRAVPVGKKRSPGTDVVRNPSVIVPRDDGAVPIRSCSASQRFISRIRPNFRRNHPSGSASSLGLVMARAMTPGRLLEAASRQSDRN